MYIAALIPFLEALGPEYLALGVVGWMMWEVYAPKFFGVQTAVSPLFNLPERVENVEQKTEKMWGKLDDFDKKQVHHIQVTRANSRALDETRNVSIDSDNVDEYLVDNGIPISMLTRDERHEQSVQDDYTDESREQDTDITDNDVRDS